MTENKCEVCGKEKPCRHPASFKAYHAVHCCQCYPDERVNEPKPEAPRRDGKCKRCEFSEMDDVALCDNKCGCHGSRPSVEEGKCECHMYMKDNDGNITFPDCPVHGKGGVNPAVDHKPVQPPATEDWKKNLNKLLWRNLDIKEWPERGVKAKLGPELEDFISSLLQRSYDRGYADGKGEKV